MKVVVTASAGRIGRAVIDALSDRHEVGGIDRILTGRTTHVGDIGGTEALIDAARAAGADAFVYTGTAAL